MRIEELERDLRAERPQADLDFARRLDEWAEAGFPRDSGLGPRLDQRRGPLGRAWDRLRTVPPRRVLLPVGAVATAVVIAGVAVTQITDDDVQFSSAPATQTETSEDSADSAGGFSEESASSATEKPAPEPSSPAAAADEYDLALPDQNRDAGQSSAEIAPAAGAGTAGDGDGIARGENERITNATARLSLGAPADEVQDVANGVVDVTDRYDGIVVNSQVTSDQAGARATFELELPYADLDGALADLSELGDVISRTETAEDITPQAVRARKDLADLHDRIREARVELIQADTRDEKLILKSQIASLEASADAAEQELNGVVRQGRFATVDVEVRSDGPAADDGDWSLGDAVDDAGRALEIIGGVALITLAILLPVALVGGVAAFALSRSRARARERALDE
jgi:hypothetical protein